MKTIVLETAISDSSEELLQRGKVEGQYMCDFGDGRVHVIKHKFFFFLQNSLVKVSASHKEQMSL